MSKLELPCPNPECSSTLSYPVKEAPKQVLCTSCNELIDIDTKDLEEFSKQLRELDNMFKG